jgi:hypothetical protein
MTTPPPLAAAVVVVWAAVVVVGAAVVGVGAAVDVVRAVVVVVGAAVVAVWATVVEGAGKVEAVVETPTAVVLVAEIEFALRTVKSARTLKVEPFEYVTSADATCEPFGICWVLNGLEPPRKS